MQYANKKRKKTNVIGTGGLGVKNMVHVYISFYYSHTITIHRHATYNIGKTNDSTVIYLKLLNRFSTIFLRGASTELYGLKFRLTRPLLNIN